MYLNRTSAYYLEVKNEKEVKYLRVKHHCHRWQILQNKKMLLVVLKPSYAQLKCFAEDEGDVPDRKVSFLCTQVFPDLLLLKTLDGWQGLFCSLQDSSRKKYVSRICWNNTFTWKNENAIS